MARFDRSEYRLLDKEAEQDSMPAATDQASFGWVKFALGALVGVLAFVFILFFTDYNSQHCPTIKPKRFALPTCGKTPEAAKAAGCIFDPMMNSWLRPECYDEELSTEFRNLHEWKFYKDQNATILLTEEEFSQAGESWGTWEFHIAHCMFSFRKLHKALLHGGKIEKEVALEPHTTHCSKVTNVTIKLLEEAKARGEHFSLQDMGTVLNTGYPLCIDAINFLPYEGVVLQ